MERIQVLIDKLQQQYRQKENVTSILATVQMLQNELTTLQNGNKVLGTSKVAVVMPIRHSFNRSNQEQVLPETEEVKVNQGPGKTATVQKPEESLRRDYSNSEPVETVRQQAAITHNVPLFDMHIDSVVEAPTLMQQQIHKEINELITNKESLNDRLKQEKKEVAHVLKDSPVKDLRKAIGVNDKFVFISELFRGDEAMYERSIKTINTFHILPEAEYWMNRELKVKLGWNDTNETVQHFYQLVRRRFS